jgi:glycosyltransferase involved in cell wall biosynthesis
MPEPSDRVEVSVVVPLYNEVESVEALCRRLSATLDALGRSAEIILVDDGSSDGTAEACHRSEAVDRRVRLVQLRRNFGQTAAISAGIDTAAGTVVIPIDGDLQNAPEDIPRLLAKLDEGFDVVSGWRRERRDPYLTKVLPSRCANWLISRVGGVPLHDYGCTLKAYRRSILDGVQLYGEMHRFVPIFAAWQGARVAEIEVRHERRRHGRSHYGIMRVFKIVLDLLVIKFLESSSQKPMYLFGGVGLASFACGFAAFILMVYLKASGSYYYTQTPLPMLVVLLVLVGVLSVLLGLVAELLIRTYHESQGKPIYQVRPGGPPRFPAGPSPR